MTHTKGEWKVTKSGNKNFDLAIVVEDGGSICHITKWFDAKGNAKLIAAAPDMLNTLLDIKERLDKCKDLPITSNEVFDSFYIEIINEAIKKATE